MSKHRRVCVCACMCACMQMCAHACVCVYANCVRANVHVCLYVCTQANVCKCTRVSACMCPYVCVHANVHVCARVYTYANVCAHVQLRVLCGSACMCVHVHTCEKPWGRVSWSSQGLAQVKDQEPQSNIHGLYPVEAERRAGECLFVPVEGERAELGSWEEKLGHPGWVRGTRIKLRARALFCSLREAAGRLWAMKQTEHNSVLRPASLL